MISRGPSSTAIRDSKKFGTDCSSEDLQMPRWQVAGRRCSESSRNPAQARRAARDFPEDSAFVVKDSFQGKTMAGH